MWLYDVKEQREPPRSSPAVIEFPASSSSSASSSASSFSSAEVKERKLALPTTKKVSVSTTVTIERDEDSPRFKWCFSEDGILGLGPQFPRTPTLTTGQM